MTTTELMIACATVLGPILAVQTQKWIERATERRRGQLQVFYWLMASRATRLSTEHVQALNRIELEFRARNSKEKKVRDAWRLYADKLNERIDDTEISLSNWASQRDTLFTDLMFEMSQALGFDFDRVQIMRGVYYPRGHGEVEERQRKILMRLEQLLDGQHSLKVALTSAASTKDT